TRREVDLEAVRKNLCVPRIVFTQCHVEVNAPAISPNEMRAQVRLGSAVEVDVARPAGQHPALRTAGRVRSEPQQLLHRAHAVLQPLLANGTRQLPAQLFVELRGSEGQRRCRRREPLLEPLQRYRERDLRCFMLDGQEGLPAPAASTTPRTPGP